MKAVLFHAEISPLSLNFFKVATFALNRQKWRIRNKEGAIHIGRLFPISVPPLSGVGEKH
jgi:hypothetical protein